MKKVLLVLFLLIPLFVYADDTVCTWESSDKKFKIIVDSTQFDAMVTFDDKSITMMDTTVSPLITDNACKMQNVYYACGNLLLFNGKIDSQVSCYISYLESDISSDREGDWIIAPSTISRGTANFKSKVVTKNDGTKETYDESGNKISPQSHGGGGNGRSFDGSDDLTGGFSFGGGNCHAITRINEIIENYINVPLKAVAILLLVGLTIVDFVKNIGDKEADPKKPINKLVKRSVACAILFFATEIVDIILKLAGTSGSC